MAKNQPNTPATFTIEAVPTIKNMYRDWLTSATRNHPIRQIPHEAHAAYYAGCANMLEQVLKLLQSNPATADEINARWRKWHAELEKFAEDYNEGRIYPR